MVKEKDIWCIQNAATHSSYSMRFIISFEAISKIKLDYKNAITKIRGKYAKYYAVIFIKLLEHNSMKDAWGHESSSVWGSVGSSFDIFLHYQIHPYSSIFTISLFPSLCYPWFCHPITPKVNCYQYIIKFLIFS